MAQARWLHHALGIGHRLLDLAYPPLCLHCGDRLDSAGAGAPEPLCQPCRRDCVPVRELACHLCGLPAVSARDAGPGPCADCSAAPPPFTIARAAYFYRESGPLRSVLLRFKHAADATVTDALAEALVAPARDAAARLRQPALCPVPLYWLRRLQRGYNQAELLARQLQPRLGLPLAIALGRGQRTKPQKGSRAERQASMQGAFHIIPGMRVQGQDFLLVDDVLTTGATVGQCARTLLSAGARAVGVVTVARAYFVPYEDPRLDEPDADLA